MSERLDAEVSTQSSARPRLALAIAAYGLLSTSGNAAPSNQLRGLSIKMHWLETVQTFQERRNPNRSGETEKQFQGAAKVYISERGRVFGETAVFIGAAPGRGRRSGNGLHRQSPDEDVDESRPGADAFPWHWSISSNTIAGTQVFSQGARQVQATVIRSGDGWQCALRVILGKSNGAMVRRNRRGFPEYDRSSRVDQPGCDVINGNIFQ